ncbi:MAG: RNA polymerase sigma factor [Pirellulales bacterium]|nr:RNA polymerase sigma factor [Pirellulales bacterium]
MRSLLEQYAPHVYRFALRLSRDPHAAEELAQETFVRAWRGRRRLREPRAARVWLFQIAANLWRDRARREGRRRRQLVPLADDHAAATIAPERQIDDREDLQRALEAMESLPSRQREVLYLHACEDLALAEIGRVLSISTEAAKASLSLARKKLRRQLRDICRDRFPTA